MNSILKSKVMPLGTWDLGPGTKKSIMSALLLFFIPLFANAYTISGPNILSGIKPVNMVGVDVPYLLTLDDALISTDIGAISASGIKLIRVLASFSGESDYSFQPAAGTYNIKMFDKLDRALDAAAKNKLGVIICLADNSSGFGGKEIYRKWSQGSNDNIFFKDRISIDVFKKFTDQFTARKNSVNGRLYAKDDTIFAWDLCRGAVDSDDKDGSSLYNWSMEMSSYMKKHDSKHLVTMSRGSPDMDRNRLNDFNIFSGPDMDLVSYGLDAGAGGPVTASASDAAAYNGAYNENVGKPVAVILSGVPAGSVAETAKSMFSSKAGIVIFSYAGFGAYKEKDGAYDFESSTVTAQFVEASKSAGAGAKAIQSLSIGAISASPAIDKASIIFSLPEKADVDVFYGTQMPLFMSATVKDAGPKATVSLEGLQASTKYLYMIKAKSAGRSGISGIRSFTTMKISALKALPFTRSNNIIKVKGTNFYDGNRVYHYMGTNNYYMRHDDRGRGIVDKIFTEAAAAGLKVIRVGSNGEAKDMGSIDKNSINRFFRIGPDNFNEAAYRGLDYVLDSAARHGMRVILHFTDYWEYYGGVSVYAAWAGLANKDMFFINDKCKEYYKQTVDAIALRKNTVNGKMYRDDPTIFAYDLMNEPEDRSDTSAKTLVKWIEEMSDYIKTKDPNHLVTTGMEGYMLKDDGTHYSGSDFLLCQKAKSIDFCTFHLYPATQYTNYSMGTTEWIIKNYIKLGHETLGKPVVMEEYGIPEGNPDFPKAKWIDDMTSVFFASGGDGANYWMFADIPRLGDANVISPEQVDDMNSIIKNANTVNKNGY
jgi:endo-1,4-beta-mannosidase